MSYVEDDTNPYSHSFVVAEASEATRVTFLKKVYGHVFACIIALCALCAGMFATGLNIKVLGFFGGIGSYGPWVFVFGFMAASWLAHKMAYSQTSVGTQYAGLALYTTAEAFFLAPILTIAVQILNAPELVVQAGVLTLMIFGGLTAVVMFTKADFGFLKGIVIVGTFAALGVIVLSLITGMNLGLWFAAAMVALMAVTILWETSDIYHHYPETAYVAASLALFSSIATLFYYILRILIALSDD